MRKIHNYRISKEDFLEMLHAGRFNPSLEITFRDRSGKHTHKLSAGYSDDIDVYREGSETYVFSTNSNLGYVDLEVFEGPDKTGEIFLEAHQVEEVLGKTNLASYTIIKRLREIL